MDEKYELYSLNIDILSLQQHIEDLLDILASAQLLARTIATRSAWLAKYQAASEAERERMTALQKAFPF